MTKTLKLEGRALELARAIKAVEADANKQIGGLKEQAEAISKAAQTQAERLHGELKHELGLGERDCCHLDMTYIEEHVLAFAKTGCETGGGLADLLGSILGRGQEKPQGGLH